MAKPVLSDARFFSEEAAFEYVETQLWPDGPTCPHCGSTSEKIGRLQGVRSKPSKKNPEGVVQIGLRKCYACRGPAFTVRKGTIFEDSHLPLRMWLQAIHLLCASKKGISTRQLQRMLNCGMKTAWHLSHRIREMMKPTDFLTPLGGEGKTVEADETFVGRKPGTPKKVKGGFAHKYTVLSLVERSGPARSFHIESTELHNINPVVDDHIAKESTLATDERHQYKSIGREFARHTVVHHAAEEYVRGDAHVNTAEGFFSIFKRGMYGVYQNVSEAHLQRYLVEFDFRYSNREKLGVNDVARATRALKGAPGRRLTYQTTR
jgi:hypothetical protein